MSKKSLIYIISFLLFLLSFAVYLKTLCPTVYWGDCGELITAAYTLGIPHPPGYPLYTLLGKLFTFIPRGSIAYRVNLMSAFFGALTVMLIYLISLKILSSHIPSLVCSLLFAFSYTFWSQAVIAEVYTLNAFFIALFVLILLRFSLNSQSLTFLYFLSFLYGLSFGNHHTIILLVPGFLYLIMITDYKILLKIKNLAFLLLFFFLGLSIYLYLPLSSLRNPPLDWGNPESLKQFIWVVTRKGYGSLFNLRRPIELFFKQLYLYVQLLSKQFTPYVAGVGVLGAWRLFKENRKLFVFTLLIFLAFTLTFIILINETIDELKGVIDVFYIPSYIVFSLWIAFGLGYIIKRGVRFIPPHFSYLLFILLLLLPLIPLKTDYHYLDRSKHRFAYDYAEDILESLEPNSIIFSDGDNEIFTLWYLQHVEKKYLDIVNLPSPLFNWDLQLAKSKHPEIVIPSFKESLDETVSLRETSLNIIKSNIGEHPIYLSSPNLSIAKKIRDEYSLVPRGLSFKVEEKGVKVTKEDIDISRGNLWKIYDKPTWQDKKVYKDKETLLLYAKKHNNLGVYLIYKGMLEEGFKEIKKSIEVYPDYAVGYTNLGVYFQKQGRLEEAIKAYKKALKLNPYFTKAKNDLAALERRDRKTDNLCGPKALALICEIYGIKTTVEELSLLAGTDEEGTTMHGLAQAARAKGLIVRGKKVSLEELMKFRKPLIAFIKKNHFVVIKETRREKILIINPEGKNIVMTPKEFAKLWEGYVLLLRK